VRELQLGDVIDDYCVKCRRLTNHAIVSIVENKAAKVRCRTCYGDHDFRNEVVPPTKRELMKQKALFNAVLAGANVPGEGPAGADAANADPPAEPKSESNAVKKKTTAK
jgi:hypothetical protein